MFSESERKPAPCVYVVSLELTVATVDAVVLSRASVATHLAGDVQETISCNHTHTYPISGVSNCGFRKLLSD
jgi:hypothetical protein